MATNTNLPGFTFTGVNDQSTTAPTQISLLQPQHFPLFMIRSPYGNDQDILAIMSYLDALQQIGSAAFDQRGPYWNHQTKALVDTLQKGNPCMVKIIRTPGVGGSPVTKASAVVLATIEHGADIYEYQRDVNGKVVYNASTNQPELLMVDGVPVPVPGGVKVSYTVVPQGSMSLTELNGTLTSSSTDTWTGTNGLPITWTGGAGGTQPITWANSVGQITYPLFMVEDSFTGVGGNMFGFNMWAATPNNPLPGNTGTVASQQALLFNAQIIRNINTSTPLIIPDLKGSASLQFMFKPNAYDPITNLNLTIQGLVTNWSDDGFNTGTSPITSPIGAVTVFESNLEEFLNVLFAAEVANNPTPPASIWMLDFLTATDANGGTAYGFQIDATESILSSGNSYYMMGGTDGSLLTSDYELEIQNWTQYSYNTDTCPATNILKYPFSEIYDTGFGSATKEILPQWMALRQNTSVHLATYVDGGPLLTQAQEISAAAILQQSILNFAESPTFGTPAYRATLVMQAGLLVDGYQTPMTANIEMLLKRAAYMGAGNGVMSVGGTFDYTMPDNNGVQYFKSLSSPNFTPLSANEAWNNGAIYCIPSGMGNQYFYPFIHSIYPNDTSILTSDVIRHICANLALQQAKVWRQLVGRDDLTTQQIFIDKSDELIYNAINGIYNSKAVITSSTFFTEVDTQNGFSWHNVLTVAAGVTKDVALFTVVATRTGNLSGGTVTSTSPF